MRKKINRLKDVEIFEYFLISLVLIGAVIVRLYKIDQPIADWHAWRQVDTASVTRTFLERGADMLRPRYHDVSSIQTGFFNPEGYRFVEMPIYNLLHLELYRAVGGVSLETAGRLVSAMAGVGAVGVLYLIGKRMFSRWVGLVAAGGLAFIPFNVYFTRVVLPDPLAVFFALLGLWMFVEFYYREHDSLALASAGCFAVAALIKPFALFYGFAVLYLAVRKYGLMGILKKKVLLLALDIVLIPFFLWRGWMNNVPEHLRGVAHLSWAFNGDKIRFRPAFWRWIFGERVGRLILGIWGLIPFSFGVVGKKKGQEVGRGFLLWFLLGMVAYVTVIATANVRHDYYQVFIVPAIALAVGYGSERMWNEGWLARGLLGFSVFLMLGIGLYEVKGFYAINHPEIVRAGRAADELLPKDAWVIAPYNGDTTFLYQTGRWGWPVVNESIEGMIEKGADYFISVNYDDDTNNLRQRFEAVEENDDYIILDLNKPTG